MEKQSHDWRHQTKLLTTPRQHPTLNIHPTCWSSRWVIINALQSAPVWHCKGCFKSLLRQSTSHARSQRPRDPSRSLHFDAPTCLVNKMISFVKLQTRYYMLLHVTTVLPIRIFRNFCLTSTRHCHLTASWFEAISLQLFKDCFGSIGILSTCNNEGIVVTTFMMFSVKSRCLQKPMSNTTRTLNNAKLRIWRDPNSNSKISL